jgi:ribosome maturation factor RimP
MVVHLQQFKRTRRGNPTVPSSFCPFLCKKCTALELTERIAQLLEEKYTTDELFADCFTVAIDLLPGNKLLVFADADSGLTFAKCQKLSRYLESFLDTNGWLGETYLLEVSSPGIDRPLKFPRQYAKNIGRTLAVTLLDKTQHEATLKSVGELDFVLTQTVTERDEKKKKVVKVIDTPIPYEQVEKAIVKLAF